MSLVENLREALGLNEERAPEISWENRLAEAAYTPPSGLRITFDYENISTGFTKRTTAFEFPDGDGALVQDHGSGARRFPMRIFFSGPDHDKQAAVFEAALNEKGPGKLESPLYGEHTVVPTGEITRADNLKTAANQTIFEVTFFKTINVVYPESVEDSAGAVATALELFGDYGAADFASRLTVASVAEEKSIIDQFNSLVAKVEDGLEKVAAVQDAIQDEFNDYVDAINNAIDVLVKTPLTLARRTQNMIHAPGKALANVRDRLEAYGNLAQDIFTSNDAISDPGGPGGLGFRVDALTGVGNNAESPNRFHVRDLFVGNFIVGSIYSTIFTGNATGGAATLAAVKQSQTDDIPADNKIDTAPKAIAAAEEILDQWAAYVAWRDSNFDSIAGDDYDYISHPGNTEDGSAFMALQKAVSLAAGALIQLSFSLLKEKTIYLDRDRNIIELTYELYGGVDEYLDFFITSNDLSGLEIIELKKGRKIVYYV